MHFGEVSCKSVSLWVCNRSKINIFDDFGCLRIFRLGRRGVHMGIRNDFQTVFAGNGRFAFCLCDFLGGPGAMISPSGVFRRGFVAFPVFRALPPPKKKGGRY